MKVLYGIFKKKEVTTIGGIAFFPENIDEKKLTLMIGDNLNKMNNLAKSFIKHGEDEMILKKIIY